MPALGAQGPDGACQRFRLVGSALAVPGLAGARQWVISRWRGLVSVYQMTLPSGLTLDRNGWRRGAMSQVTVRDGDHWFTCSAICHRKP